MPKLPSDGKRQCSVMFVAAEQFIPPRSGDGGQNKICFIPSTDLGLQPSASVFFAIAIRPPMVTLNTQQDKKSHIIIESVALFFILQGVP